MVAKGMLIDIGIFETYDINFTGLKSCIKELG